MNLGYLCLLKKSNIDGLVQDCGNGVITVLHLAIDI